MNIKKLVILCLFTLSIVSCTKETSELSVLNLEGEFIISADQELTFDGPRFSYNVSTVNDQNCQSSNIVYTLIDAEGELNLILEDITILDNCPTEKGHVEESIPINTTDGTADIAVSLRNVVKNKGTIKTTSQRYTLELLEAEGILIGNTVVNKMPVDVLFGYIYNQDDSDPTVQNLSDTLSSFSNGVLIDGYYTSYFSVYNQQAVLVDDNTIPALHQDVYYRLTDKEAFKSYVANYKETHPNIGLILRDAENGEILIF